jgi:hypothetical protein
LSLPWWHQRLYIEMNNDEVAQQKQAAEEQQRAQRSGGRKGRSHTAGRGADSRIPMADGPRPAAAGGEKVSFGELLARRQAGG